MVMLNIRLLGSAITNKTLKNGDGEEVRNME